MQKMLYREAYKVLGDAFEAEDAVQNLYVRLWEQMETLDHLASPEAYCRTVLKHICIDRWRAIKARDGDVELVRLPKPMRHPRWNVKRRQSFSNISSPTSPNGNSG